jgi:hypothetical protein
VIPFVISQFLAKLPEKTAFEGQGVWATQPFLIFLL